MYYINIRKNRFFQICVYRILHHSQDKAKLLFTDLKAKFTINLKIITILDPGRIEIFMSVGVCICIIQLRRLQGSLYYQQHIALVPLKAKKHADFRALNFIIKNS